MEAEARARLNRAAATLAGYTFTPLADGEQVTDPQGTHWSWLPAGAEGPDFVGEPGLWWGLVEGMTRALAREGNCWRGPELEPNLDLWVVTVEWWDQDNEEFADKDAGICAVRACLAVAAALGLGAGD